MSGRAPRALRSLASSAEGYICPSCLLGAGPNASRQTRAGTEAKPERRALHARATTGRLTNRLETRTGRHSTDNGRRHNGSLASNTAINAPSTVPPAFRVLHQRLNALQDSASGFVDLSRLQLALRSLESSDPVIRVALLGLGEKGVYAAKQLARVLLTDALGSEEEWERRLLGDAGDGRSLSLRYGDVEDLPPADSPLVRTLLIPSPFLKRHGLEIMVTGLNAGGTSGVAGADKRALEGSLLVPALSMPNTTAGRMGFVRYPVHKALIVGEGVEGAVESGRLLAAGLDEDLFGSAINLPMTVPAASETSQGTAHIGQIVNTSLASHALQLFRENKANGVLFSDEWEGSRVSAIAEWLAASNTRDTESGLKRTVAAQISSALRSAGEAIDQIQTDRAIEASRATVSDAKRAELQKAISTWSADAHKDLQLNIATALGSRPWRRTAWFRLLWRIDDVSYSAADILRRSWLNEAEQTLAFLSGRILESNLATVDELKERGAAQRLLDEGNRKEMETYEAVKGSNESVAELMQMPMMLSRVREQSGVNALFDPPWPQTVYLARARMLHTIVPALHRKAQTLLVTTLTTISGTSALGAWYWVATGGAGLAEAGAVAALGLVWSLRRLQKQWGTQRESFEVQIREDGRRVLAEVEGQLRKIVSEGGRVTVRLEDVEAWQRARSAVDAVEEALKQAKV